MVIVPLPVPMATLLWQLSIFAMEISFSDPNGKRAIFLSVSALQTLADAVTPLPVSVTSSGGVLTGVAWPLEGPSSAAGTTTTSTCGGHFDLSSKASFFFSQNSQPRFAVVKSLLHHFGRWTEAKSHGALQKKRWKMWVWLTNQKYTRVLMNCNCPKLPHALFQSLQERN